MEKKEYEAPAVTKVEIDFSDRIIAAGCGYKNYGQDCQYTPGGLWDS